MSKTRSVSCINNAYRLLARRSHSVYEMRQKLESRGYEKSEIDEVLRGLSAANYLDDAAYCRSFASARMNKMKLGPERIKSDLARKGFDGGLIAVTLAELFKNSDDEMTVAIEAARKKLRSFRAGMDGSAMKRKLYDHLTRKGFSRETARNIALNEFKTIMTEKKW